MEEAGVSLLWVGQRQSSPTGVAGYGLQKSEVYIGIQSLILLVNRLNNNNNNNKDPAVTFVGSMVPLWKFMF